MRAADDAAFHIAEPLMTTVTRRVALSLLAPGPLLGPRSGEIRLSAIQVADLDASIGGSGRFVADGHAGKLAVSIARSGRCDAERLVAGDVAVSMAGSGAATVHADNALSVAIAGSGDVLYRGNAMPRATIVGSGRLQRL